jgi:hypothetical protein
MTPFGWFLLDFGTAYALSGLMLGSLALASYRRHRANQRVIRAAVERMAQDAVARVTSSVKVMQATGASVYVPEPHRLIFDRQVGENN